jgi:hypothetical protein
VLDPVDLEGDVHMHSFSLSPAGRGLGGGESEFCYSIFKETVRISTILNISFMTAFKLYLTSSFVNRMTL